MTNGVYTAVLVAITFAICPASNGQYFLGCPPVDDVHDAVTILPNPFNCSTFYICAQGTPLLFVCPGNLQFNYELQVCDYPERANCFELQQYPEPVTTSPPVFQPGAEHLLPEQAAKSEHEAGPEPTSEEAVLTPELKREHAQERAQSDSQDMVVPSKSIDEPLQTSSEEQVKANKDDLVEPLKSVGTPEPQPSQEPAEPQHQQKDNERSDETERELEPVAEPTNGAPGFELQPEGSPTEPGIQDTVMTAETTDKPNQEPSQEPTESDHEAQPQASKDQAEPELERDINAHSEQEFGRAIERTDSTPEPEPRPTQNPSQPERQVMVLPAESADETRQVLPQELNETDHTAERAVQLVVSTPQSQPWPLEEQAIPEREKLVNEQAIQTKNEQGAKTEPNAPTTESERHLTEQPAESEIDTEPAVEQVEPAGKQELASSEKLTATTLQPEPQPTDGQAAAETARQPDDFQAASTELGHEGVPESTQEPAQSQTQQPDEPSEVVHDETKAEQTVEPAQELAEAAPEPTAVAPQLEAEAVEEPVGIVPEPSETIQGQEPAREPEQQDQTTEIAQFLHEPVQSAYESTGKTVDQDTTENEAILSPQSEQSVPDSEQIDTKQPSEDKAEQSETKPQLRPTQEPLSVLDEASLNSDASGTDMEQLTQQRVESSTELDQSEKQATPKSADAQPQLTEVTQKPRPAPEAELPQPEAEDGTVEHSPSASEAPVEARSEPPAGQSDEIEAIQTDKSIETKHLEVASDTEDDVEPTSPAETEPPVSEKAPEPLEHKADTTEIASDTALSSQDGASTSEPNASNQDAVHQASGGPSGTAQFEPAPTDAVEQASNVTEPTLEPESSAGIAVAEEQSKADNAYEETEKPAEFDDVDEEGTRNNAVEIDYYT